MESQFFNTVAGCFHLFDNAINTVMPATSGKFYIDHNVAAQTKQAIGLTSINNLFASVKHFQKF